jgi:hypothetical protein
MQTLIAENDKVTLSRKEAYNHSTTASVTWVVRYKATGLIVRETKTRKEALVWFNMHNA